MLNFTLSLSRDDMIGLPYNFQHVSHAGFDRDNNFSQFNIEKQVEDQIRELFKEVSFTFIDKRGVDEHEWIDG